MRTETTWRRAAAVAIALGLAGNAAADAGIGVAANSSAEEYTYPAGSQTVSAWKITLSPWWANNDWLLSADIPLVSRQAEYEGTAPRWSRLLQRYVLVTGHATEEDSGLGDSWLHATRSWQAGEHLKPYAGGHLRVPTGDPASSPGVATLGTRFGTRSGNFNDFSLGKDGVDFRLAPGITAYNDLFWGTVEPSYTWTTSTGEENRAGAYAGIGITPWQYIEAAIGFDYEDALTAGGSTLEQVSYSITLHPQPHLAITASTTTDTGSSAPDSNWSLGVSADW